MKRLWPPEGNDVTLLPQGQVQGFIWGRGEATTWELHIKIFSRRSGPLDLPLCH